MESVCLRLGGGAREIGPVDPFGFSWRVAVSLRSPSIMRVGFPWISSSESRLFNELRSIKRGNFLTHAFSLAFAAPQQEPAVEAMRKGRIVHGASLT
jgi:hypothetical protein